MQQIVDEIKRTHPDAVAQRDRLESQALVPDCTIRLHKDSYGISASKGRNFINYWLVNFF